MGLREAVQQQQGWAAIRCLERHADVRCGLGAKSRRSKASNQGEGIGGLGMLDMLSMVDLVLKG